MRTLQQHPSYTKRKHPGHRARADPGGVVDEPSPEPGPAHNTRRAPERRRANPPQPTPLWEVLKVVETVCQTGELLIHYERRKTP